MCINHVDIFPNFLFLVCFSSFGHNLVCWFTFQSYYPLRLHLFALIKDEGIEMCQRFFYYFIRVINIVLFSINYEVLDVRKVYT